MKIAVKFKYENEEYNIVEIKEKYKAGVVKNNQLCFKLNENQQSIVKEIVDKLYPTSSIVKIRNLEINGKTHELYYNYERNLFLFPGVSGNDLKQLNYIYNNQDEWVYSEKLGDKAKNYFKRIVNVGKKSVVVLLTGVLALSFTSTLPKDIEEQFDNFLNNRVGIATEINGSESIESADLSDVSEVIVSSNPIASESLEVVDVASIESDPVESDEAPIESFFVLPDEIPIEEVEDNDIKVDASDVIESIIDEISVQDLTVEDVLELIKNNPNLSDEEKEFILSLSDVFYDNFEYMDKEKLIDTMKRLHSEYTMSNYDLVPYASGTYTDYYKLMTFYGVNNFEETSKSTYSHEFGHSLQGGSYIYGWLREGINAAINDEYSEYDSAYSIEQKYVKALIELIGVEPLKKANYIGNDSSIHEALYEIISDYELAINMLSNIELIHRDMLYGGKSIYDIDPEIFDSINSTLGQYYEAKYNRKAEDDLIFAYYMLDYSDFLAKAYEYFDLDIDINFDQNLLQYIAKILQNKCYFNKSKLNSNNKLVVGIPKSARLVQHDFLDLDEALAEGAAIIDEEGNIEANGTYIKGENNVFYRQYLEESEEKIVIEIDDSNRYINNELNR